MKNQSKKFSLGGTKSQRWESGTTSMPWQLVMDRLHEDWEDTIFQWLKGDENHDKKACDFPGHQNSSRLQQPASIA